ncbi:TIGR03067 domain-containing protein [Gemmata sp. JC717]|uniref:TIGR03067 domain-containing protein n=1 Tax=Gemmata algarum TaxID=2975278 RepID=UPI0021BB0DC3|nr:TIGR03067 domain-containing protein [Gemmata algarum]MDY3554621.1 TIGR03067 domain-containing protein [Gemmata algarum]
MRTSAFTALLVGTVLAAGCGKTPAPAPAPEGAPPGPTGPGATASDQDRCQGYWKMVGGDKGDGMKPPSANRALWLNFSSTKLTYGESSADPGETHAVVWDTAANPKTLTLTPSGPDGKPLPPEKWIYQFDGDHLLVAFSGGGALPTEFKARTPQPSAPGVLVLKFEKSGEKPPAPAARPLTSNR